MKTIPSRNIDFQTGVPSEELGWVRNLAQIVFVLLCVETLYSVPYRSVYLAYSSKLVAGVAAVCVLAVIGICFAFRELILQGLVRLLGVQRAPTKRWLAFWLILGLALRIAWILCFPVTIKSDHWAFFQNAALMASGHNPPHAFWPPGFSLFLAPFFALFGAREWVTHLCALLLFVATYFLTYALALRFQGGRASRLAPALVAVWPGYFTLAGINFRENLLAVLLPAALLLYLTAFDEKLVRKPGSKGNGFRWRFVIAAGLCMGFATLTQPSYMLYPAVIFGFEILRRNGVLVSTMRTAVFSLALVAAISPWTIRNYLTFHRLIPVSTNGGYVFYYANNPYANANTSREGDVALDKNDIATDKLGYKLGEQWIAQNPGAFAVLMVRKQIVYLGDDALGAYETLKRDLDPPVALYASVKGFSNLYWLAVWAVLLLGFKFLFRLENWRLWFGVLFLPLLYEWAINSVFESGPRHHVPYVSLIAILVSMVPVSIAKPHTQP